MQILRVIAASLVLSSLAFADDGKNTAELKQAVGAKVSVVANGNVWECVSTTCRIVSAPKEVSSMRTCRELRRQVGLLSSYGSNGKPFDIEQLAKCNAL